jgi:hypothetical protein
LSNRHPLLQLHLFLYNGPILLVLQAFKNPRNLFILLLRAYFSSHIGARSNVTPIYWSGNHFDHSTFRHSGFLVILAFRPFQLTCRSGHSSVVSRVSLETSFDSKQLKLEPKLVSALSETKRLFRLFRFFSKTASFGVSVKPKLNETKPKQAKNRG